VVLVRLGLSWNKNFVSISFGSLLKVSWQVWIFRGHKVDKISKFSNAVLPDLFSVRVPLNRKKKTHEPFSKIIHVCIGHFILLAYPFIFLTYPRLVTTVLMSMIFCFCLSIKLVFKGARSQEDKKMYENTS